MSPSDPARFTIDVEAAGPATELFVVNGDLELVARGVGRVRTAPLEEGIYKIKERVGIETRERLVVLRGGNLQVRLPPFTFASPVPFDQTSKTHEYHIAAATSLCKATHVKHGSGSSIFVFAREWSASKRPADTPPMKNPGEGLLLRDTSGAVVTDLQESSLVDDNVTDPYAACAVDVDPGLYRLALRVSDDLVVTQTVVASPGMQTQIFLLPAPIAGRRLADLTRAAVLVVRQDGGGFSSNDRSYRLAEIARLALTSQRKILGDDLRSMLRDKFENPMLGVYAGHLLLLDESPDLDLLGTVVWNLRRLLGPQHPDVEALGLRVSPSEYRFAEPPMLKRSWALVVEATLEHEELTPADSAAVSAARRMWGDGAWCSWNDAADSALTERALERAVRSQMRPPRAPAAPIRSPFAAIAEKRDKYSAPAGAAQATQSAPPSPFESARRSIAPPQAAAPPQPAAPDEGKIGQLMRTLGLPRRDVEHMLATINLEEDDDDGTNH